MDVFKAAGILALSGFTIGEVKGKSELISKMGTKPETIFWDFETDFGNILVGKTIGLTNTLYRVDWRETHYELPRITGCPDGYSLYIPSADVERLVENLKLVFAGLVDRHSNLERDE